MEQKTEKLKVDYHFHPNLPKSDICAERKITEIYKKFEQLNIRVVLITEHIYKNYTRAWQLMKKYRPDNMIIFPGIEYVTKENIDICLFSETEQIYQYDLRPFQLSYKEVISFLKSHADIFGYVTHPFTLGQTSIMDKKGREFTKAAINEIGAVEARYTVFHQLRTFIQKTNFLSKHFTKLLDQINKNEQIPLSFYPSNIKFLAAGSDAHHTWEIGTCAEIIIENDDIFYSIINNKDLHAIEYRSSSILQTIISLLTTLHEWWLKRWFKIWN